MSDTFGWDIGGVHLKGARLSRAHGAATLQTRIVPFEIWKNPADLASHLGAMFQERTGRHAVTMTAELSDVFASRSEGVRAVLRACADVLPGPPRVLDLKGRLLSHEEAMERPLEVTAANWLATARLTARGGGDALLIDVGSTTTDIIPVRPEGPDPEGRTDTERLLTGELVYTGVLRTPPSSLADRVPLRGGWCRVSSEFFTVMGDVYRILGDMSEEEYTIPTPDRRGKSREDSMARLARLVCADLATLERSEIEEIARFLKRRQIEEVGRAIAQVLPRKEWARSATAVTAGAGSFLAEAAATRAALATRPLDRLFPAWGGDWTRAAPAAALAVLLAEEESGRRFTI